MKQEESIRRILREDKKTKSTNKEFSKYKDSKFNSLIDYTLQDIVDNWDSLSDHKNENIKTIKHFINNPDKITDLVYDEKGLEDGYHRLIAAKILKKPRFSYRLVETLQESIKRIKLPLYIRRRTNLVDRAINNLLPNMYPCDYNSSDHFVEGVLDEIKWFLGDVKELQGIERMDIKNYILDYKYDELTEYFNERCVVLKNDNLQESIRRVLREEINIPLFIRRRLYLVDEYINNLDPEDVCNYWRRDESKKYVNESMADITRNIIFTSIIISDDKYTELYDHIYGHLQDLGYKEKFKDFFYESLQNCNPKHRMRFMKP